MMMMRMVMRVEKERGEAILNRERPCLLLSLSVCVCVSVYTLLVCMVVEK